MSDSPYGNMTPFTGGGSKSVKVIKDLTSAFKDGLNKTLRDTQAAVDKLNKSLQTTAKLRGSISGGTGGGSGSGTMSGSLAGFSAPAPGGGSGGVGIGMAGFSQAGFGAAAGRVGLGLASFAYGGIPNTMDAVNQRVAAQSAASFSGMSANQFTSMTNNIGFKSGGMTSSYGMQLAGAQMMYSGGYTANSSSFKTIMPQVGGLSAATGMSNAQVASAYAGMNGMNGLRMGVRVRDSSGGLLAPNQIASNLYGRMYGNKKITDEQAALVYNPGSRAYKNVMALAGGNQDLFNSIATNIQMQAKNGGKTVDLSNANKVMDSLGYAKDDPRRANFKSNAAQAKLLQSSSQGLLGGYKTAADASAATATALSGLIDKTGALGDAFVGLKGTLESLPGFGNTGSSLGGLASSAIGGAANIAGGYLGLKGMMGVAGKGGVGATIAEAGGMRGILGAAKSRGALGALGVGSKFIRGGAGAVVGGMTGGISHGLGDWLQRNVGEHIGIHKGSWVDRIAKGALDLGVGAVAGFAVGGPAGAVGGTLGSLGNAWKDVVPQGQAGPGGGGGGGGGGGLGGLISTAMSYVGRVPYVWGGHNAKGWDCSGFVQQMFSKAGVNLPRTAAQQSRVGSTIRSLSDAKPGDLLFFHYGHGGDYIDHVGIYIGGGRMVEAANRRAGTRTSSVSTRNLAVIKRVLGGKVGGNYNNLMNALHGAGVKIVGNQGDTGNPDGGLWTDASGVHSAGAATVNSMLSSSHGNQVSGASMGHRTSGGSGGNGGGGAGGHTSLGGNAAHAWNYLTGKLGFTAHAAAGVIGNLMQESGINPGSTQHGGGPGRGIMQWTVGQRWAGLEKWASGRHMNKWALDTQLGFMAHEMDRAGVLGTLAHSTNYKTATSFFENKMERAGTPMMNKRYNFAADALQKFGGIKSYDVGEWSVNKDQIAKIHDKEMILPKQIADAVRGHLKGGSGGGSRVTINVTLNNASDAEAMKLARRVKHIIEQDTVNHKVGIY